VQQNNAPPPPRREAVLEALNAPARPEGEHVTGLLTLLDCTSGLTLHVRTDAQMLQLHSDNPTSIQFLSYVPDVSANITCGPRDPGIPVTITYQKEALEPLVVEFIETR
jgi:hypothetical protein